MKSKLKSYLLNNSIQESLLFMVGAVVLLVYALQSHYAVSIAWKLSPYLFPALISIFLMGLSVSLFCDGLHQLVDGKDKRLPKNKWKQAAVVVFAVLLYYLLMPIITFVPATVLFLVAMFVFLGERRWWLVAILALATTLAIYFIFGTLLHVMLP